MRSAIDFYARGKEREVHAGDYDYRRYPKGRFICPECGEFVYLSKDRALHHVFKHYPKEDLTPDCDRRVDGAPVESIYERVGVPLYVRERNNGDFQLCMYFRPLSRKDLMDAERTGAVLAIGDQLQYRISSERFSDEHGTWIDIDYVPRYSPTYQISITHSTEIAKRISLRWGDTAEGLLPYGYGAVFNSDTGRKFHKGDSISTDTNYYWIMSDNGLIRYIPGIVTQRVGRLVLRDGSLNVYRTQFRSDIDDRMFSQLSSFLLKHMGLHLLEKEARIIPVWPPAVKRREGYLIEGRVRNLFGIVESGNENPDVYAYYGEQFSPVQLTVDDSNIMGIPLSQPEIYLNIDRKYVSTGLHVEKGNPYTNSVLFTPFLSINGNDDNVYEKEKTILVRTLSVSGNVEVDAVLVKEREISVLKRVKDLVLHDLKSRDSILLLLYGLPVTIIRKITASLDNEFDYVALSRLLRKHRNSCSVSLPVGTREKLLAIEERSQEVTELLNKGRIPLPVLRYIEGVRHE